MAGFHQQSTTASITAYGASSWVYRARSHRSVKYRFLAHYHPYTDELIEQPQPPTASHALLDPEYHAIAGRAAGAGRLHARRRSPGAVPAARDRRQRRRAVLDLQLGAVLPHPRADRHPPVARTSASRRPSAGSTTSSTRRATTPASPCRSGSGSFLRFRAGDLHRVHRRDAAQARRGHRQRAQDAAREGRSTAWRDKPFQPHVIARGRALAYQLNVRDEVPRQPHRMGRLPVPPGHRSRR